MRCRLTSLVGTMMALVASSAYAQTRVYVSAPRLQIIAQDTMQLSAVARNTNGDVISSATFQWITSAANIAQVDSTGKLTATGLGLADITATYAGVQGILRVQVIPKRIDISPANATVPFGTTQQFTATAYDVRDTPIPNVSYTWHLTVFGGFDSTTASISNGLVRASALGTFLVRAAVTYPNNPNQFQQEFDGQTQIKIVPPPLYKVSRLASNDYTRPQTALRGPRKTIAAGGSGTLYFSGILDGMSNGLLQYSGGAISAVALAGVPSFYPSSVVTDFDDPAPDSSGNVVARMSNFGTGAQIVEFTPDGGFYLITGDGDPTNQGQLVSGCYTNRYSLSDTGDVVFRANVNDPNVSNYKQAIMRNTAGFDVQEVAVSDTLPGFNGPIGSFDNFFGIDANGAINFVVHGSTTAVYRKEAGGDPVRLIGTGDAVSGNLTLTNLYQYTMTRTGDLYAYGSANTGNLLIVFPRGAAPAKVFPMPTTFISTLFDANGASGLALSGDLGLGYGLYNWNPLKGSAPVPLILRNRPLPSGEPFSDVYAAAIDGSGKVYAIALGVDSPWLLTSFTATSGAILASSGDSQSIAANANFSPNLVPGDRTGGLHMLAGGNQASVFSIDNRAIKPVVLVNDRFPGGQVFWGNQAVRKSASGSLYFVTDAQVYRMDAAAITPVVSFPVVQAGVNLNTPYNMAVNDRGQVVMIGGTSVGAQHLSLYTPATGLQRLAYFGGSAPYVTASPGGGTFSGFSDLAVNEAGQVMVNASVSGAAGGLFLWDGSSWQTICQSGNCTLDGQSITAISNVRAAGTRFCASTNTRLNVAAIRCYDNGAWSAPIAYGDLSSDGTLVAFVGPYDVNRKGEVAAVVFTNGLGGPTIFFRDANGYSTVVTSLFPWDATVVRSIYSIDLKDDGRIFFTGLDDFDRLLVYEADPIR